MRSLVQVGYGWVAVTVGAVCLQSSFATALDWDGDFPVSGNYNGKIDNPDNWVGNVLPGTSTGVGFLAPGAYTVAFGVDFETGGGNALNGGGIRNGSVTFESLTSSTRTYAINGDLDVRSNLRLDDVALVSGPSTALDIAIFEDGTLDFMSAGNDFNRLAVGSGLSDGNAEIDGGDVTTNIVLIGGPGGKGGVFNLINNAQLDVNQNLLLRLGSDSLSELSIASGSDVTVGGDFRAATNGAVDTTATIVVDGVGSTFTQDNITRTAWLGTTGNNAAAFTVSNSGTAVFRGDLEVRDGSKIENLGGTLNLLNNSTIAGEFRVAGGVTNVNAPLQIESTADFLHLGGTINFNDDATFNTIDEIVTALPGQAPATWNIGANDTVSLGRRLRVGSDFGESGLINVTSAGAVLTNSTISTQADLVIGLEGTGTLNITNGGVVDFYDDTVIGQDGTGSVFLEDAGSRLDVNRNGSGSNLFVGLNGAGSLKVRDGAAVDVSNDLVIEASSNASASSVVVGNDSGQSLTPTVSVGNDLLVGPTTMHASGTTGTLTIEQLGQVVTDETTVIRAGGALNMTGNGALTTRNLDTTTTSGWNLAGGTVTVEGGTGDLNHGRFTVGGTTPSLDVATFRVEAGAEVSVNNHIEAAPNAGTIAAIIVTGEGSFLQSDPGLFSEAEIGQEGTGLLAAADGGRIRLGGRVWVGNDLGGNGTAQAIGVTAGGVRSTIEAQGANIGGAGTGSLEIRDGGLFFSTNAAGGIVIGSNPLVEDGSLNRVVVSGSKGGFDAELQARLININGADSTLRIEDGGRVSVFNTAAVPLFPAQINFSGAGRLELAGGHLDVEDLRIGFTSVVDWTDGDLFVDQVNGELDNLGTGTLHVSRTPGVGSLVFTGSGTTDAQYRQGQDAALAIELAGLTPGTQFDTLTAEIVELDAGTTLDVSFINGFTPTLGNSFTFLTATDSLTGTFDNLIATGLDPSLGLAVVATSDTLTLQIIEAVSSLAGDYSGDGFVSQADLDLVLLNWGSSTIPAGWVATDQFDGVQVSQNELDGVLLNWGNGTPPSANAVPEPASAVLLALSGLVVATRRRRSA